MKDGGAGGEEGKKTDEKSANVARKARKMNVSSIKKCGTDVFIGCSLWSQP